MVREPTLPRLAMQFQRLIDLQRPATPWPFPARRTVRSNLPRQARHAALPSDLTASSGQTMPPQSRQAWWPTGRLGCVLPKQLRLSPRRQVWRSRLKVIVASLARQSASHRANASLPSEDRSSNGARGRKCRWLGPFKSAKL